MPVGSIKITTDDNYDPNGILPGRWELIRDRFLYSTAGKCGETGGEAEHRLTIDEMPGHRHKTNSINVPNKVNSNTGWSVMRSVADSHQGGAFGQTADTGENSPHNNMPPYLTVHAWLRVA